jgi:hypothetical protein
LMNSSIAHRAVESTLPMVSALRTSELQKETTAIVLLNFRKATI